MSKKFNLKNVIEVAISKEMDVPDEVSGLILHKLGTTLHQEDDFSTKKASSEKDLVPTQPEMDMINASARVEQDASNWYVFRNVNVTGPLDSVDGHGDLFSLKAAKTMAEQVTPESASPIITDHWHDLGDRPPVGKAIAAKATNSGLIETWAIPREDYNSAIVKGLLNGTINKISIGAFISPADKLCNSCGNKSIYDSSCPHIPLRNDEKGNLVTVTIKDVKRYAERSLVNIPARLGTSVGKGLAPGTLKAEDANAPYEDDSVSKDMAPNYDYLKETVFPKPTDISKAFKDALCEVFGGSTKSDSEPPATIPDVINEEDSVSEVKPEDVKAPETEESPKEQETVDTEAPASEETVAPETEVKSVEVPVVKELEVEELAKSFKLEVEPLNKALTEVNEKFAKLTELQEKNAKDLGALQETVVKIAEHVVKLAEFSTEEAINQLLEVANQLKGQKGVEAVNKTPDNFNDFVSTLVAKK